MVDNRMFVSRIKTHGIQDNLQLVRQQLSELQECDRMLVLVGIVGLCYYLAL